MAKKVTIPNNLGPFLTKRGVQNLDVHTKTSISTSDLSQLRKGIIKSIDARKLYLIAKAANIRIKTMLLNTYPNLQLVISSVDKPKRDDFGSLKEFFDYIQDDVIRTISDMTGLIVPRIKNIKNDRVNPDAHELYLIELASGYEPGTLFKIKFKDLKLNTKEEQERLLELERSKSRKKSDQKEN